MAKLDTKNKKILALLDEDSRMSLAQIGRRVGLSVPAVENRLRHLEENIIFEYYTIIDITRLGYSQYKLYFKFQDTTLDDERRMIEHWVGSSSTVWVAQVRGRWDLAVSILAQTNYDFGQCLAEFMNTYAPFILEKDVLLTEYSPLYTREYFGTEGKEFVYGVPKEPYVTDDTDRALLRNLSVRARMPIIEIMQRTGLSRDVVTYHMKKLKEKGVIIGYRCYLRLAEISISLYKVIIRTKNFDADAERRIRGYVHQHAKATQLLKLIGSWDLEIEFETENEDELYGLLTELRKEFADVIRDFDIIRIPNTYKYNFYPFPE